MLHMASTAHHAAHSVPICPSFSDTPVNLIFLLTDPDLDFEETMRTIATLSTLIFAEAKFSGCQNTNTKISRELLVQFP